ncbi:MAG TPA: DUF58 domain-containing protein [Candidatus Limnocylindrales bacterium]
MIGLGAGLVLIVFGALLRAPGLIAVGVIVILIWFLRTLWTRFGLRGVTYERKLGAVRALVGEEIPLELTVRNRKLLPLPWLEVEDFVSEGAQFTDRPLEPSDQPGFAILRTTWTLGWFQRVTRRINVVAERRGIYDFSTVRIRVADLFAPDKVDEEHVDKMRYRIVPRYVPVRAGAPMSQLPGSARVPRGLFEDAALFAGVRPYQPGDALRRIHWKATARLGQPVSRRYDPVYERDVVIALDVQTIPGPFWMMQYEDDILESLCVAAMSLARSLIVGGVACGLAVNAYQQEAISRSVHISPSSAHSQISVIADQLADLSRWPSLPFATLLHGMGRRIPPTTSVVALTAIDSDDVVYVLNRMARSGRHVQLAAIGRHASDTVARAGALGVPAAVYRLEPNWRTADALKMAG